MASQTAQTVDNGSMQHEHTLTRRDAHSVEGKQTQTDTTLTTTTTTPSDLKRGVDLDTYHNEEYTQPTPKHAQPTPTHPEEYTQRTPKHMDGKAQKQAETHPEEFTQPTPKLATKETKTEDLPQPAETHPEEFTQPTPTLAAKETKTEQRQPAQETHPEEFTQPTPKLATKEMKTEDVRQPAHPEELTQPTPKLAAKEMKMEESVVEKHDGLNVHATPFVSTNTFHSGNSSATTHSTFSPKSIEHASERTQASEQTPVEVFPQPHSEVGASKELGWKDEIVGGVKKLTGKIVRSESLQTKGETQIAKGKEEVAAAKAQKENLSPHFAKDGNNGFLGGMESVSMQRKREQEERNMRTGEVSSNALREPLTPRHAYAEYTQNKQFSPRQKHTQDVENRKMTQEDVASENVTTDENTRRTARV